MVNPMKLLKLLPVLFLFSCIELIIQEQIYNSLYFTGGSWIEFAEIDSMKLESNDFTIQFWVSGDDANINERTSFHENFTTSNSMNASSEVSNTEDVPFISESNINKD